MYRRKILKSLGLLPLGLLIPKMIEIKATTKGQGTLIDIFEYKDFKYLWSGWKGTPDSERIAGQWLAVNSKTKIHIYSSTPGGSGQYLRGQHFNLTCYSSQHFLETTCKQDIKDKAKGDALLILFKEIDRYWDELKKNDFISTKKPEYRFTFTGFKNTK